MPKIPAGRDRGKSQLRVQDILTHLAEYHAETNPTERRIYERAFPEWFRVHAENGCSLAKELMADPNWMRRFPVLTFNNAGAINQEFIRRRLAVPEHLTDERDMFWRVRTNAVDEVAQYLDAAYERAVTWDSDAERDILLDALMTVAKRDDWPASVVWQNQKFLTGEPHAIGDAARQMLDRWSSCPLANAHMLSILEIALEGRPVLGTGRPPIALDVLFRQVFDAELHFRERARRPVRPRSIDDLLT